MLRNRPARVPIKAALPTRHSDIPQNASRSFRPYRSTHADEANAIVAQLFEHLGAQRSEKTWQLHVRRAWTLFAASHAEIHRVAQFIFHKDPTRLAHFPSLYAR